MGLSSHNTTLTMVVTVLRPLEGTEAGDAPATATRVPSTAVGQVLSAEMRFSADKGLSAERPAGAGFLAEKWRRRQLRSTWGARESNRRPLPPATYALTNLAAPKTAIAPEITFIDLSWYDRKF